MMVLSKIQDLLKNVRSMPHRGSTVLPASDL
jgi:hypothetical protein